MIAISSTQKIPEVSAIPQHVAIIMDGNGRWAAKRFLPRVAGHAKGVEAVRGVVQACAKKGVKFLTLFAFSSENWRRPVDEVSALMGLFINALEKEVDRLHQNGIRLRVVGDLSRFNLKIQELIAKAEVRTASNLGLTVTICANYGGRWDIIQATNKMIAQYPSRCDFTEDDLTPFLAMAYAPEPDLFIRTGGEKRVSNFFLWQLAYTELYFSDVFWPDFSAQYLDAAIESFTIRERRFGRTSLQVKQEHVS